MVSQLVAALELPISQPRLEAYRRGSSDLDMVVNYLWNVALSEALYPTLQTLEVALRNTIHTHASTLFGNAFWFDDPASFPLEDNERRTLENAKRQLHRYRVPQPWPAGKLIAELGFGFWTGLLHRPYDTRLWRGSNSYQMLRDCFPHSPRFLQRRDRLAERYDRVRALRNRVFHHEPIWYYTDLATRHVETVEAIGWISPVLRDTMALFDRFPLVYDIGRQRIGLTVSSHLT